MYVSLSVRLSYIYRSHQCYSAEVQHWFMLVMNMMCIRLFIAGILCNNCLSNSRIKSASLLCTYQMYRHVDHICKSTHPERGNRFYDHVTSFVNIYFFVDYHDHCNTVCVTVANKFLQNPP